ncbi:MAG: hypothetical protein IJW49_10985 [Clostridia bacterium]|nr:hypothetical protein [Clostridia bacterium]
MENEAMKDRLFPNGIAEPATYCDDCDEESICNCESNERVTPYYSDSANGHCAGCKGASTVKQRCKKIKKSCCDTFDRLKKDWKSCGATPYIKQTRTCRTELYKSKNDTKPIDSFQTERTKACSLQTLALLGAGLLIVAGTVKHFFKQ